MVNQEVSITVRCSEPMKYFIYQIVGRGDILLSRAVDVSCAEDFNYILYFQFALSRSLSVSLFR